MSVNEELMRAMNHVEHVRHLDACHTPLLSCARLVSQCESVDACHTTIPHHILMLATPNLPVLDLCPSVSKCHSALPSLLLPSSSCSVSNLLFLLPVLHRPRPLVSSVTALVKLSLTTSLLSVWHFLFIKCSHLFAFWHLVLWTKAWQSNVLCFKWILFV